MGGVHACMTAGLYPHDLAITPLLAPRSAAIAYCDGAFQPLTAWQPLLATVDQGNNRWGGGGRGSKGQGGARGGDWGKRRGRPRSGSRGMRWQGFGGGV